jgi:hypothetical protein
MKVDCQISDHATFIILNFAPLCNLTNELILYDINPAQASISGGGRDVSIRQRHVDFSDFQIR